MMGMKVKTLFFDRKAVQNMLDKRTAKVFGRFGAFVRKAAQWSIRKAGPPKWKTYDGKILLVPQASKPGQPPLSHRGLLKKFLFYSLDPASRSVVIGPTRLKSSKICAPEVLEYGGTSETWSAGKDKSIHVAARPFMAPAFDKGKDKLTEFWKIV